MSCYPCTYVSHHHMCGNTCATTPVPPLCATTLCYHTGARPHCATTPVPPRLCHHTCASTLCHHTCATTLCCYRYDFAAVLLLMPTAPLAGFFLPRATAKNSLLCERDASTLMRATLVKYLPTSRMNSLVPVPSYTFMTSAPPGLRNPECLNPVRAAYSSPYTS
eukprot:CAMPEP_0202923374 /NCGR_PEP_ID=MMETSP1392-20130828/78415_1 /ASSEMBLY_ACC=CAM_ASM_000868 /TAXON_ID=225041 /ORGANISM="Chlamydomonas chlamydogama, Strain SAG 11-48b" /LENGTH=163 /DNA_ID=CAMNT_0049617051 /DNA_START=1355 /DNA_END=1846 /DNA_ORIENTATION=+